MITSNKGINLIKSFEGLRLASYQDSGGVWTIGYGHTSGVTPGMTITEYQALLYLKEDLKSAERYVNAYVGVYGLNQNQFDALVSFTYNAGCGNLKKRLINYGKKPLALVRADLPETCIKAGGKTLTGLIKRREKEAELMGDCREPLPVVAQQVLDGLWGNGLLRKRQLTDAGYDYSEVQLAVNQLVGEKK